MFAKLHTVFFIFREKPNSRSHCSYRKPVRLLSNCFLLFLLFQFAPLCDFVWYPNKTIAVVVIACVS